MKPVVQEEQTGCAIACAAAIAGISYQEARKTAEGLGICADDKRLWSETGYIRRLLDSLGFDASGRERPFTSWEELPDCALLSIKWHQVNGRPYWHWVVFAREGERAYVLDSSKTLKSHIRTDFGRMKPKWYIAVSG